MGSATVSTIAMSTMLSVLTTDAAGDSSVRQRIGAQLEMNNEGFAPLAAFHQPGSPVAAWHPETTTFPASFGIIDTSLESLAVKSHRIGNSQGDEFAIDEGMNAIEQIACSDGHVCAEPERVVLVYPSVVAGFHTEARQIRECRTGKIMERPAFRTVFSRCCRTIQTSLALASIKFTEMTTAQRHPDDTAAIDIRTSHAETG